MLPYLRTNRHGRLFQGYVRQAMLILFECLCAKPQSLQCLDSDYTPPYRPPQTTVAVSDAP
jgi:hypothetical protein